MSLKKRIEKELDAVKISYPKLDLHFRKQKTEIVGNIDIIDDEGTLWDNYFIKISIPANYPISIPLLYETVNKIPKIDSRHINPDGTCCLAPTIEIKRKLRNRFTIVNFIGEFILPFLANQTYFDIHGEFASKEYSHGVPGIIEYYQEKFKTQETSLIINILELLINHTKTGRNESCFCGSNKKFKNCHESIWSEFNWLDIKQFKEDLFQINQFIDTQPQSK